VGCLLVLYAQPVLSQSAGFAVTNCNELSAQVTTGTSDDGYLIVMSESPIDFIPVDNLSYPFSLVYGLSTDVSPLSDGEYIVYNGVINPTVTGFVNGNTYYYKVYFFMTVGNAPVYSIASSAVDGLITLPEILTIDTDVNHVTCNGFDDGSIDIDISNGNAPFSFLVNNVGVTVPNSTDTLQNFGTFAAGTYTVSVQDATGCINSTTAEILEPDTLEIGPINVVDANCFGANDGFVEFFVNTGALSGSVLTYSILTPLNVDTNLTTGYYEIDNIPSGVHQVIVLQDQNALCADTLTFSIGEPTEVMIDIIDTVEPACGGINNGTLETSVSGGAGNYTISWENSAGNSVGFGNVQNNLAPDTYTVSATDASGCVVDTMIVLDESLMGCLLSEDIPNVITPNADGANDSWYVQGLGFAYPDNRVTICNRWGDPVFERNSCGDDCWNGDASVSGEPLPTGTYFYVIELDAVNGSGDDNVLKGTINLLR